MYSLDLKREPFWLDLGLGVRVRVLPFGTEVEIRSRELPGELRAALNGDFAAKSMALVKAFGRGAIVDWDGLFISGRDDGRPWPEGIDALLETSPFGESFQQQYVFPALLGLAEKNASAPSPSGTSGTAEATAPAAPGDAPSAPEPSTRH